MNIDLDKTGLIALVKGSYPDYKFFEHSLVKKAGHSYSEQYGTTYWHTLGNLSEKELYELYLLCRRN